MYKLLIVDDEPLVQVGIKSMLPWQESNIEVCATASNGQTALELIEKLSPDIVITDIKMPVMDGLELLKTVRERYGDKKPAFLLLTSYEDFGYAKEALKYRAQDYLVKVELTPETLKEAIDNVLKHLEEFSPEPVPSSSTALFSLEDKFRISLLNNLFESREQMLLQAGDLNIDLSSKGYLCCYGSFEAYDAEQKSLRQLMNLYESSLQMVRELAGKYRPCTTITLDLSHFALILKYANDHPDFGESDYERIKDMLSKISVSLQNYYNVSLRFGIGYLVTDPLEICESYQYSRLSYRNTDSETPIVYMAPGGEMSHEAFHFSLFQKDLIRAFEEYNSELIKDTFRSLCDLLGAHPHHFVQALDAASNILYLSISLLPEGEKTVSGFFERSPEGYMSLYRKTGVDQIVNWLEYLSDCIASLFDEKKKDYKNRIVSDVKTYINEHVSEKLSLNEVAARFGISPSYLSQLFGRYNETGFSEYINICKVEAAKRMLRAENSKVYEVADALSFGSEFYFSKVFKKIEGITPTEYMNGVY